jgi:hypothetical protein
MEVPRYVFFFLCCTRNDRYAALFLSFTEDRASKMENYTQEELLEELHDAELREEEPEERKDDPLLLLLILKKLRR